MYKCKYCKEEVIKDNYDCNFISKNESYHANCNLRNNMKRLGNVDEVEK